MKIQFLSLRFFSASVFLIISLFAFSDPDIRYYGKEYFLLEGTTVHGSLKEGYYDRLPISYKTKVREEVWDLSRHSAGLSVRFRTNSSSLNVKWTLLHDFSMNHMAFTGIKGIDLYYKSDTGWQYINTARPTALENEFLLIDNMDSTMKEFKMYLPLYDGVVDLQIGIDKNSRIIKPSPDTSNPIVFYGTSITQGGCASRPGMAYTSIISRKLETDCINFGFSGNGRMEEPIAELIAGINASIYVIDCLPNMNSDQVRENTIPLVKIIREKHPSTPIVLVENLMYERSFLDKNMRKELLSKNQALKDEYTKMKNEGYQNIYYIDHEGAIGDDHEATVDGVHFTDLGFLRFADHLISGFKRFNIIRSVN